MPFNLSFGEIAVVMLVALLVFGGKLPQVARQVGKSLTDFKRGMNDELRNIDRASDETSKAETPPPATTVEHGPAKD